MPFSLADTEPLTLQITEESEVSLLAANDPVFSDLKPDDYKGYFRFRIATSFPAVIGPEMHGRYFGFHPQVLANSYKSLLHQQTNLGHMLKAYGAYRDRIIGSIVGVGVGNLQRCVGPQKVAATTDAAQYLDCVAVFYKMAEGVKDMLGNHISSRQKQSVSIEAGTTMQDMSVYDPRDGSILSMADAMAQYPKLITMHKDAKKGLQIGKVDGVQFALAAGGDNGSIPFRGVGVTPTPAEVHTARIIDLKACASDEVCFAAMALPEWEPGSTVSWTKAHYGDDAGHGVVMDVIISGSHTLHGMRKTASASDPLLDIKVSGKKLRVLRHSTSVRKC